MPEDGQARGGLPPLGAGAAMNGRDKRRELGRVDRALASVLVGVLGLYATDTLLRSAGLTDADQWLAGATVVLVVGWLAAGVKLPEARLAAFASTLLYALADLSVAIARSSPQARPELVSVVIIAVASAHAGRRMAVHFRRGRTAGMVIDVLLFGRGATAGSTSEDLGEIGVTSGLLDQSGLLGALRRDQSARGRAAGATAGAICLGVLVVGRVTGLEIATASGLGLLAIVAVAGLLRFVGVGTGRTACEMLIAGHFDPAVTEFLKTLSRVPADTVARIGLGIGHVRLGRHDSAIAELLTARQYGFREIPLGVWIGVERQLGIALRESGSAEQAKQSFERVLSLFPDHAPTVYDLAMTLAALGERRAAEQALERAARAGCAEAKEALRRMAEQSRQAASGE